MKIKTATIIAMMAIMTACGGARSVSQWSDQEIDAWFAVSDWQTALPCKPGPETDKRQFAEQVLSNPEAWQAALEFLQANDPASLANGTYDITPDGSVYASVARYTTNIPDGVPGRFDASGHPFPGPSTQALHEDRRESSRQKDRRKNSLY